MTTVSFFVMKTDWSDREKSGRDGSAVSGEVASSEELAVAGAPAARRLRLHRSPLVHHVRFFFQLFNTSYRILPRLVLSYLFKLILS